jgi:protein involved in polysaccharide export with SLBB domain
MGYSKIPLLVIFSLIFFLFSCAGPIVKIEQDTYYNEKKPNKQDDYILGPGDTVQITYFFSTQPSEEEYLLEVGDVINVDFFYHPETNKRATIRPDGKITLPRKGDIRAAGLSTLQLNNKIIEIYSDTFKNPELTIELIEFSQALKGFKEAVRSDRGGHSKEMLIRPDGFISPFFLESDIKASGQTIDQLKRTLSDRYKNRFSSVDISIALFSTNSNIVYVNGEVRKPSSYQLVGPTTVTQILSQAGIIFETAALKTVLVLSRSKDGRPVGRLVNIEDVLNKGNIGDDLLLKRFDVVYVPKNKIAQANQFVDQYINKIIPRDVNLSFTYRINPQQD